MKPPVQLELRFRRRGGAREGAGRPPKGSKAGMSHLRRPKVTRHTPVHVTLRMRRDVWQLRSARCFRHIQRALHEGCERFGMRITDFSVQRNHIHLIAEADDGRALARGIQGLSVRIAKRLNRLMDRNGKVFDDRYHARVLASPLEVRRCVAYVVQNFRHHAMAWGERFGARWIDPFSSGPSFEGWRTPPSGLGPPALRTCAAPKSWLRNVGWKRHGLIAIDEVPGPLAGLPA